MTEELSTQQKSPSAAPYFATGAVVGGAGTWGLSKMDWAKKYVTDAKYNSYEDIIKEAEDTFTERAKNAVEEDKTFWNKATEYREVGKTWEAEKAKYIREHAGKAEEKELIERFIKENGSKEDAIKKATEKYKNDLSKGLEGKVNNKKLAMYIAGGALAVGLLATLLKPKSNNA